METTTLPVLSAHLPEIRLNKGATGSRLYCACGWRSHATRGCNRAGLYYGYMGQAQAWIEHMAAHGLRIEGPEVTLDGAPFATLYKAGGYPRFRLACNGEAGFGRYASDAYTAYCAFRAAHAALSPAPSPSGAAGA